MKTDMEKLDILYNYSIGEVVNLKTKIVKIIKSKHFNDNCFAIYADNILVSVVKDMSLIDMNNKLCINYPYASIKIEKSLNILDRIKMRFGKYKDKMLSEFIDDKQYLNYCLNNIPNLTTDYKLHFELMKNHQYCYETNYVYNIGDEININELTNIQNNLYVSQNYGNIYCKSDNEIIKYNGNVVEKENMDFYVFE